MPHALQTLYPTPFDGQGPSYTCERLLQGAHLAGYLAHLYACRVRVPNRGYPVTHSLPRGLNRIPYNWLSSASSKSIEKTFLDNIRPGDIAYLWPSVSLTTHEILHKQGNKIVQEAINTRMESAKILLDGVYESIGEAPEHGITDERVVEENEKLALSDAIFCPNIQTEAALKGTSIFGKRIPTSYGTDFNAELAVDRSTRPTNDPVIFVFVGYACVRKGIHLLLDMWENLPKNFILRIVGGIEPLIKKKYSDILNSDRVQAVGFSLNVYSHLYESDVFLFPTFEEGGPIVTYEAANAGLPLVVSPHGGARICSDYNGGLIIDPFDVNTITETVLRLGADKEERLELGKISRQFAHLYDWNEVGKSRVDELSKTLGLSKN